MLVNEEEECTKALKRRRRQKAFASVPMDVSSEGTQNVELLDLPTVGALSDTEEGSSHAETSHLNVSDLLGVAMTSESHIESLKACQDFTNLVSTRLNISVITSNQAKRSFVFGY